MGNPDTGGLHSLGPLVLKGFVERCCSSEVGQGQLGSHICIHTKFYTLKFLFQGNMGSSFL